MNDLFKLVAIELEVDVKEVEKIYTDYSRRCKNVFLNNPLRDIYYPEWGSAKFSEERLLHAIRKNFKERNIDATKGYIKVLKKIRDERKRI